MTEAAKERYCLIDALRGLSALNMILYHFLYDIFVIYELNTRWMFSAPVVLWERYICFSFIIISGISLNLSRHFLRRGITVSLCGILLTAATAAIIPSQTIWFGILTLIGASALICGALKSLLARINPVFGAAASLLLFAFLYGLPHKFLGFFNLELIELPDALYSFSPLAFFGLPPDSFYSSDYFPLFPWIFLFLFGFFLRRTIKKFSLENAFRLRIPALGAIGKYSLWIYLIHQPVLMGACFLIFGR